MQERIAAEREGKPFLLLRDGAQTQHLVRLPTDSDRLTIGRGEGVDLALDWDERVSRVHAELEHVGDSWAVADDGLSRNGTFVNG
jgi:pSer/pThr/pTyr-binding forkhead associated (FHA) protein